MRVPDGISPIVAVRVWRIKEDHEGLRLYSIAAKMEWPPLHDIKASCWQDEGGLDLPNQPPSNHRLAPNRNCKCGVWGLANREALRLWIEDGVPYMAGVIQLWGKILEGTQGWRGQYARPVAFFAPRPYPQWKKKPRPTKTWDYQLSSMAETYNLPIVDEYPDISHANVHKRSR